MDLLSFLFYQYCKSWILLIYEKLFLIVLIHIRFPALIIGFQQILQDIKNLIGYLIFWCLELYYNDRVLKMFIFSADFLYCFWTLLSNRKEKLLTMSNTFWFTIITCTRVRLKGFAQKWWWGTFETQCNYDYESSIIKYKVKESFLF